jgi:hypothetical protein
MKVKLIDKYGFTKVIEIEKKVTTIHYGTTIEGFVDFKLHDVPKRGLPVFRQVLK